ncbi:MAG: hypothetical protein J6Q30_01580 [Oscillospiraceae bacterium]|nr:hypothetical protein [Oscillospiraceae bacterium]
MASKPDIRYINRYVSGTAAPKLVPQTTPQKKPRLPKPRTRTKQELLLRIDPVAIAGIAVAMVLLVLMIVGVSRLNARQAELSANTQYLEELQTENVELKDLYQSGYDLEEIERIALALGMVPKDTLVHETIQVTTPAPVEEPSRWENFWDFVAGLFA